MVEISTGDNRTEKCRKIEPCEISLDRKIAKGYYGKIYTGKFEDKQVAVKQVRNSDESENFTEEFLSEVFLLEELRHENVIGIQGYVVESEKHWIIMELCGGSLEDLNGGLSSPLDQDRLIKFAIQIARAITLVHAKGYVHRDIKAENVLISLCGENMRLCDFGLTRREGRVKEDKLVGTTSYLAPEILSSDGDRDSYTKASDVYAFGILLYDLNHLGYPFFDFDEMDLDDEELVDRIISGWRKEEDECDIMGMDELIESCLSMEPDDRPTMEEVLERLIMLNEIESSDEESS